jgi:8-oxo-dGTP diphosphatase
MEPKMQKYVLVFPYDPTGEPERVMLIRKAKPEWQKGRLNLVGGKVEPGESFDQAAEREFREETSVYADNFRRVGTIRSDNSDFVIGVYTCLARNMDIVSEELERVDWYEWEYVKNDPALMDNLKTVIPLLRAGMQGWALMHGTNMDGEPACFIDWETQYAYA